MKTDSHAFHALLHSADLVEADLRQRLAPLGLQPRQARVLEAMGRIGPVSQSDLAAEFGVSPASISTMTDRLLDANYVTRRVDPNSRRKNILELTEEGRALLGGIMEIWTAVDDSLAALLGDDAGSFFARARELRVALGGTIPGASLPRAKVGARGTA